MIHNARRLQIAVLLTLFSSIAKSAFIDELRIYHSNYSPSTKKERIVSYVQKSNPCVTVEILDKKEKKEYCKLDDSGLDLLNDYPTIYVTSLKVNSGNVDFVVGAPWNSQKCMIEVYKQKITCNPLEQ
ncbi:hypothetical protein [Vibrio sp. RE88]|uniref:hypothetical protein n=1 Tax=Vibrio sp. RE88 TaxID=2607610 RepID=UPI00149369FD|nr:hypothetical protein [Vibrio sp. RE88]